eukprot:jgi/Chlat1/7170/Chrsp57S06840
MEIPAAAEQQAEEQEENDNGDEEVVERGASSGIVADSVKGLGVVAQDTASRSYLVVYNIGKRHNLGTLARCCSAFGVSEVLVVGEKRFNTFGSHGAADFVKFRHVHSLDEAREYLKRLGCTICGIEIVDSARPVQEHPFQGSTAFLLGNEGSGLSSKQMAICDEFVYIQQYGSGTASLNVAVAASIVFHHFALWAGFQERQRQGNKFVVGSRPSWQEQLDAQQAKNMQQQRQDQREHSDLLDDGTQYVDEDTVLGAVFCE